LNAPYPNPFNPATTISYSLEKYGKVSLVIYDIQGRKVHTLVDEYNDKGSYDIIWDASGLSTGMYILQMVSEEFVSTQKLMLIK